MTTIPSTAMLAETQPLLFIIPIVLVIIGLSFYFSWKRRQMLRAWARKRRFRFSPEKRKDYQSLFSALKKGHSRYGCNVVSGQWQGRKVEFFDYHYTTGHGKNSHQHSLSAVLVHSPQTRGKLLIRPEGLFDKVSDFFGFDDIDFESEEFSRKFFVKSPDKKWAYAILHAKAIECLLPHHGYTIEFQYGKVLLTKRQKTFQPADFEQGAKVLTALLDMIPDYLKDQSSGDPL